MCITLSDGALSALCVKTSKVSKKQDKEGRQKWWLEAVCTLALYNQRQADGYT